DARFLMMNNDGHKQPVYFNAGLADETGQGPSRTSAQDVGRAGVAVVLGSRATEDERAQKLIRHLQETLDALPQAFAHWDGEGQLIAWNHHFCELLGIPSEELRQGMRVQRVAILAGPRGSLLTQHLSPLASGQRSGEVSLSDGRRLHFIRQRTASRGWVSVAQDITDRYAEADTHARKERELQMTVKILEQSRQELKELNERYALECQRAEDANRAKTEFLANISHELRTPLNAINGFSALMQSELYGPLGSDKYSEYVNDIHDSGKHLLELINEILDLSKVEAGRMELRLNMIDLEKILTESIRVVEPQTREADINLHAAFDDLPSVFADARAVKQVALNLLTNAVKFTAGQGRITITTVSNLDTVSVIIADTGEGITQDNIKRLGTPFVSFSSAQKRDNRGTGLGLALSKSLVEAMDGILCLASERGRGTVAAFTLPRRPGIQATLPDILEGKVHILTKKESSEPSPLRQMVAE
ncbi:MAG: ATP-binding protein, partial [Pseudomonadota bacterium]